MHSASTCFNWTALVPKTASSTIPYKYQRDPDHVKGGAPSINRFKPFFRLWTGTIFIRRVIFAALLLLVIPGALSAAQVTLTWDPNGQATNEYRVYQRQAGEVYDYGAPVWPKNGDTKTGTICSIDGLADDTIYYFVVRACQGNEESDNSNEVEFRSTPSSTHTNKSPVAKAGAHQKALQGNPVHLDGSGSYDIDGDILTYNFTQTAGPQVNLNCSGAQCSFTAPGVPRTTALAFELTVEDEAGLYDTATSVILVAPTQQEQGNDDKSGITDANHEPLQPFLAAPADGGINVDLAPTISATSFEDPDEDDYHLFTQWQITDATGQRNVADLISMHNHLRELQLAHLILDPSSRYSARVRFFDSKGLSSDWSSPAVFATAENIDDMNKNNIPDDLEVSAHTDMNNDTIADRDQHTLIKSISTYDGQHLMGIIAENGGNVIEVAAVTNIDPRILAIPPNPIDDFPFGLLVYKIHVQKPGDNAYATLHLSDPIDAQRVRWMRYDSIHGWKDSSGTTAVDVDGYVVERTLKDGGEEDADGVANGVIVDVSSPVYPGNNSSSLTGPEDDSAAAAGGGGGGGGCFVRSLF